MLAQFFHKCRKMGENQNWKMAWKMENLFSWWIFWLDGALRQIPMVVINHSDYSVIFITNWSALMFLTDDKFLGSTENMRTKKAEVRSAVIWKLAFSPVNLVGRQQRKGQIWKRISLRNTPTFLYLASYMLKIVQKSKKSTK